MPGNGDRKRGPGAAARIALGGSGLFARAFLKGVPRDIDDTLSLADLRRQM